MLSILDNDCAYHSAMATKINTPRILLPTKNTKILPMKFNTRTVFIYILRNIYFIISENS